MSLIVLGASGFLGSAVLEQAGGSLPITAISRRPASAPRREGIVWHAADLSLAGSLDGMLAPGDVVMNLAYLRNGSRMENATLVENVIASCARRGVSRFVHCSTAVVVGRTRATVVTEKTSCEPFTPYERTKLELENIVLGARSRALDVGVLRPTAIVGPRGENLVKLARALATGASTANYLRACLFGSRWMHLVPVRTVAAAALHLALLPDRLNGEVYIVAADDDPGNDFRSVERCLAAALGVPQRKVPVVRLPSALLSLGLRMLGRSATNTRRRFASDKLLATRFSSPHTVASAVREFGAHWRATA